MALWGGSLGKLSRDEGEKKQMIRSPKIVMLLSASFICCNGPRVHANGYPSALEQFFCQEQWPSRKLYISKNESDPILNTFPLNLNIP
jgi:hypothetical protein